VDWFVEVLALKQRRIDEVLIQLPEIIVSENVVQAYKQITKNTEEFINNSTKRFIHTTQKNHMREAMVKGYTEMSQINLSICSECLHVEYEAEHMVERLVSGG
jgi:CopG family transcriptional regulator/antitoxin EndoAI